MISSRLAVWTMTTVLRALLACTLALLLTACAGAEGRSGDPDTGAAPGSDAGQLLDSGLRPDAGADQGVEAPEDAGPQDAGTLLDLRFVERDARRADGAEGEGEGEEDLGIVVLDLGPPDVGFDPGAPDYEAILDRTLEVDGEAVRLRQIDAVAGPDGRVYVSGVGGGGLTLCSFNGRARWAAVLEPRCESFAGGPALFPPRVAVGEGIAPPALVVWDLVSNQQVRGRYLGAEAADGVEQALFDADIPSVNHPAAAWYGGRFVVVSQWLHAIGRVAFDGLPARLEYAADWDACPSPDECPGGVASSWGPTEHKGPTIAAARGEAGERLAWASYYGDGVFLHTCRAPAEGEEACTTDAVASPDFDPQRDLKRYVSSEGYPGWPDIAVDASLGVHLAWTNSVPVRVGADEWTYRGIDYYALDGPDLEPLHLYHPGPGSLGEVGGAPPSVATNASGDTMIAFTSASGARGVYTLVRAAGADSWAGPMAEHQTGKPGEAYSVAVAGVESAFWVIHTTGADNELRILRMAPVLRP